ncbi:MAG TPA: acyl-CoA dehydrogenase family protein [Candidatus Limnocylindria bacterium]|nr:acyl-CoA dehydrogenase family protein [Candidatus Limnocylindria bacterium]
MPNYFTENADLLTTFDRVVRWDEIVPRSEGEDADVADTVSTWREVLSVAGEYIGSEVAGRARKVDELGVIRDDGKVSLSEPLRENIKGLAELGLIGLSFPKEHGGSGLPFTVTAFVIEMLARACASTMIQNGIAYTAPAAMIFRDGTDEQKERYLPALARGEISGAVAMTEPEAGSDVGNLSTSATQRDGCWFLDGRKQFISAGNGDFVIVLARSAPGSKGLDGLSLFVADRWVETAPGENAAGVQTTRPGKRENYQVERAEHKFTIRGSPTCSLVFEGTRAMPLGEIGQGWRGITRFMNESRIGVGIQGLGIAQAALVAAQEYAARRVQMDKPIREHPMIAEMLLEMETTVAGLRALIVDAAALQDAVIHGADERTAWRLRELTPLVKWYGSEEAVHTCRRALQIFGGYGVVTEYDVERHMRDALITPIYEGTSQIQSLMAVRDLMRSLLRKPQSLLSGGPSATLARAKFDGEGGRDFASARSSLLWTLRGLTTGLARKGGVGLLRGGRQPSDEELRPFMLNAERITETLAHIHVARALGEQAKRVPEREPLFARAARRAKLVAQSNAKEIGAGDGGVFERIADWERDRTSRKSRQ